MSVLVFGLSYKTAPVALLERVAVPADDVPKALASLLKREHIGEAVIVSTCNRVEVYAAVSRFHGGVADLRNAFSEWGGVAPEDFVDVAYDYYDDAAAAHLFSVAAGLDSMVVGERQIHLQIRQAFAQAQEEDATGRVLDRLFRHALRVGKRARNETAIAAGGGTMVDVGLAAAEGVIGDLAGRTVLVVGAGKMGGMAARRLRGLGAEVVVTNRSPDRSERLAERVDGDVLPLSDLVDGIARADLVLASTGASQPLVDVDTVAAATAGRARPLVLLDLAVPRDVDPACGDLPGVTVLDVDAVRAQAASGPTGEAVAAAEQIVAEEAQRFAAWTRTVRVEPTIAALRSRAEQVRAAEVERLAGRLGDLDERQRDALEALTRGIVNTLLHEPTVRLKQIADARGADHHAAALAELFDLDDDGPRRDAGA